MPNKKRGKRLLCPPYQSGRKVVYLIGTDDGRLKIGLTKDPLFRAKTHHRAFGVKWVHFFPSSDFGHVIEYNSKSRLAEIGERLRKTEMYRGIEKADAIRVVREVTLEHLEMERQWAIHDAEEKAWREFKKQYVAQVTVEKAT